MANPRTAERRPRAESGAPDVALGDGNTARIARGRAVCPFVRAAATLADPVIFAAIERWHPASCCPAARREAA